MRSRIARGLLNLFGWRTAVVLPDVPKMVILAAPHTTNWDGLFAVLTIFALNLKLNLFAKHSLFRWPFGGFMRWCGMLPVDRRAAGGLVAQTTAAFAEHPGLLIGIAPEGTRTRNATWKSGFWQIARAANVPIVCAYLDYEQKICGIGPVFMPSESFEADLEKIQVFYRTVKPHSPENFATPHDGAG